MPRLSLKDRLVTPKVARAMVSPAAIVAVGAGASVGIVAGLPIIAAVGIGAAAWVTRVGIAVPRNPKQDKVDPSALSEPWRGFVKEALEAAALFESTVKRIQPGPLHDRLAEIAERVRSGVDETWRIARAGESLCGARNRIDVADITRQLTELGDTTGQDSSGSRSQTMAALDAQLATATRMDKVIVDTRDRLRLIDAKRDEAVTRVIELSARSGDDVEAPGLTSLDEQVDSLVDEMDALRQALDETG